MSITKNDLLWIDTTLDWKRPATENQTEAVVDYVEFEIIEPERFEKLAQNLDRCGSKDGWTEEEWKDITNKNGDSYEYISVLVHILPLPCNEYNVDKVYTECRTDNDSCQLVTENVFNSDELEAIMEEAVERLKEAKKVE